MIMYVCMSKMNKRASLNPTYISTWTRDTQTNACTHTHLLDISGALADSYTNIWRLPTPNLWFHPAMQLNGVRSEDTFHITDPRRVVASQSRVTFCTPGPGARQGSEGTRQSCYHVKGKQLWGEAPGTCHSSRQSRDANRDQTWRWAEGANTPTAARGRWEGLLAPLSSSALRLGVAWSGYGGGVGASATWGLSGVDVPTPLKAEIKLFFLNLKKN